MRGPGLAETAGGALAQEVLAKGRPGHARLELARQAVVEAQRDFPGRLRQAACVGRGRVVATLAARDLAAPDAVAVLGSGVDIVGLVPVVRGGLDAQFVLAARLSGRLWRAEEADALGAAAGAVVVSLRVWRAPTNLVPPVGRTRFFL